jgi:homoserine O-acetyltransferase
LVVSISSDQLCPPAEQSFLAKHLPHSIYREIDSSYGHDGFLIEWEKLSKIVSDFLAKPLS